MSNIGDCYKVKNTCENHEWWEYFKITKIDNDCCYGERLYRDFVGDVVYSGNCEMYPTPSKNYPRYLSITPGEYKTVKNDIINYLLTCIKED